MSYPIRSNDPSLLINPVVLSEASGPLLPELAGIVSQYAAAKIFGPEQWSEYFGVEVPEKVDALSPEFYAWWNGPDPIDPQKRVSETHIAPIYCPRFIRIKERNVPFNLALLNRLIQKPRKGNACPSICPYPWYARFGNLFDQAPQSGKWLVMRKEIIAKNQTFDKQLLSLKKAGDHYLLPSAIDLATVTLIHYVVTKEYYLGAGNSSEAPRTLSAAEKKLNR